MSVLFSVWQTGQPHTSSSSSSSSSGDERWKPADQQTSSFQLSSSALTFPHARGSASSDGDAHMAVADAFSAIGIGVAGSAAACATPPISAPAFAIASGQRMAALSAAAAPSGSSALPAAASHHPSSQQAALSAGFAPAQPTHALPLPARPFAVPGPPRAELRSGPGSAAVPSSGPQPQPAPASASATIATVPQELNYSGCFGAFINHTLVHGSNISQYAYLLSCSSRFSRSSRSNVCKGCQSLLSIETPARCLELSGQSVVSRFLHWLLRARVLFSNFCFRLAADCSPQTVERLSRAFVLGQLRNCWASMRRSCVTACCCSAAYF